jgi:sugar lactone lactonase YvrE
LKVGAIANTGADVYVLDTGSGQLWRYQYGVAGFNPPPQAFFTSNKPDLTHARSFAFDSSSLFVLDTSGTVRKFDINTANPQPFTVHLRTPLKAPSSLFTNAGLNNVWIADPPTGRIVQLDKSGIYERTYVSASPSMNLTNIEGIAAGPAGKTLYVLSGSRLYDFPVVY